MKRFIEWLLGHPKAGDRYLYSGTALDRDTILVATVFSTKNKSIAYKVSINGIEETNKRIVPIKRFKSMYKERL